MKVVKLEDCINEIKSLDNNGFVTRSVNHICEDMRAEVKEFDAIPVPKNATNGDMIKVMFPNAEIKRGFYGIERAPLVCLDLHTSFKVIEVSCLEDWWNAPYKKEVE